MAETAGKPAGEPDSTDVVYRRRALPLFDNVTLVSYSQSPVYVRVNPYILHGYLQNCFTVSKCLQSTLYLHNQTLNVWTHVFGYIVVLWCLLQMARSCDSCVSSTLDWVLLVLFALSVGAQFIGSAAYHAFVCHSESYCRRFRQLDYIGVIVHIGGLEVLTCFGLIRHAHTAVIAAFLSAAAAVVVLTIVFMLLRPDEKYIIYTGMVLLVLLSWVLPWHAAHLGVPVTGITTRLLAEVQLWYAVGMIPFLTKVPERWWPGAFDTWFASHQIWHVAVTVATIREVQMLLVLLEHDPIPLV